MHRRLPFLVAALVALAATASAGATPAVDVRDRQAFAAAFAAAQSGPEPRWRELARGLEDYPLHPYLVHAALVRQGPKANPADVRRFLAGHPDSLLGDDLRGRWLRILAERNAWREFIADWAPTADPGLQCLHLRARRASGDREGLAAEMARVWVSPRSLPQACDELAGWLREAGALTPALAWQRIDAAARAGEPAVMRIAAPALPPAERAQALAYADALANPAAQLARAKTWTDSARAREIIVLAIQRLARRDSAAAGQHWLALAPRFDFSDAERARAAGAIAIQRAASSEADAAAWFARVPAAAIEDETLTWQVREALARDDRIAARRALDTPRAAASRDPRLRWLRGRMYELDGAADAARAAWTELAREANFHAFLAADRLDLPYSICPLTPSDDTALRDAVAGHPGLARALEWHARGDTTRARREWDHTLARLSADQRPLAVAIAQQAGWLDRGPLTLLRPEEIRYYAQRFPIGYRDDVAREAGRHGVAPAWVFGLMRSESAFVVDARSSADARGLMQLLPSTARQVARIENLRFNRPEDLYQPALNIRLGTRYMAKRLDMYDDRIWIATAAYNAGPAPVQRWLAARPSLPADLWIETIPYRETREYVARVLAFATIYDWRLEGDAASVAAQLRITDGAPARRRVECALPEPTLSQRNPP
jgi:soluble lytic murein transglycosylase